MSSATTRKSVRLSSSLSSSLSHTKQHGSQRKVAGSTDTNKDRKRGIKSGGENKSEINLAAGSDSDQSDDQEESCTLTKRMKENVLDNAEFFSKLGIGSAKLQFDEVKEMKKTKPSSRGFKEQKVKEVLPRRKSLRLQNKDPGGSEQPVKDVIETQLTSRYDLPRKAVSLHMSEVLKNNQEEGAHERFMDSLRQIGDTKKGKCKVKVEPDLQRFVKSLEQMTINETQVAKVVPERVFSVAIHPTERALLVAAGDKWGRVGLWDVNSVSNQDGVFCYEPHVRPVKHLCFPGNQPDTLYSCSYDGSLRCLNFTHGKFQELYSTPPDEDILVTGFDFFSPTSMIVSQGEGGLVLLDTR